MERSPISIRQAFNFAWPIFKKRFALFTAVLLTIFGAWVALEIVVIAGLRFGILLWIVMHLAFLIFFAGLEVGLLQVCLALYDGKEPTFADSFAHLALGPKFLAGQTLYLLAALIGLLLLIIPGVYLGVRYALVLLPPPLPSLSRQKYLLVAQLALSCATFTRVGVVS